MIEAAYKKATADLTGVAISRYS
eukprot:SAG31_NODE_15968_length_729_cov_0.855556_1_plen_22_part_01